MLSFHNPYYFFLFVPLALIIGWKLLNRGSGRPALQYSQVKDMKRVPRGARVYLRHLPSVLLVGALSLMIVALARPQLSDTKTKRNVEGIDIVFVLDISDSMLIEDMQPQNRMESAKKTIEDFVRGRGSDRMGLVVFSGESYTRVPLTMDYEILLKQIQTIEPQSRDIKMGTAIGVGLTNGINRLKESTAKSRVVILLTDGENNSGTIDPLTALEIAKGYKIRIYTIGVGIDGEAQLPVIQEDSLGNKYKRYQPIHSKVNDDLLTQLASETGGKYYRASTTNALAGVFKDINSLEKSKIEVNQFTRYTEDFQKYVFAALWLYFGSLALGTTFLRRAP